MPCLNWLVELPPGTAGIVGVECFGERKRERFKFLPVIVTVKQSEKQDDKNKFTT